MKLTFDGETFDSERDGDRLTSQFLRVFKVMADGDWHTLSELSGRVPHASEAAISARLRDFRKKRFGEHTVDRRYLEDGIWEYRLVLR